MSKKWCDIKKIGKKEKWRETMGDILYLECSSGISGDMTVAALLDLGADEILLKKVLSSLPVKGFQIKIKRVKKSGLDVCDFDVILDQEHENHDHDMEYLHGNHENKAHHIKHEHRGIREIMEILQQTEMTERARKIAITIFDILAEAEANVHGMKKEDVHFHEVGAVDSIVDIVAAAVCIDDLNVEDVIISELAEGQGVIRCQHGWIPVPVPAVMQIVQKYNLVLNSTQTQGELVTPTGAAIAAAIRTSDQLPEQFKIKKVGMGAGKRTYDRLGILRAMFIETQKSKKEKTDEVIKLETNIDDCTGEALGYVMERLFEKGARDVSYLPLYMKKNRPAYQLNVICTEENRRQIEQVIFENTTTIGIRRVKMERTILKREVKTISTPYGAAAVKVCQNGVRQVLYPEYESVAQLSRKSGRSYQEMYQLIMEQGKAQLKTDLEER